MYHTPITYQTYLSSPDKGKCLLQAIRAYRVSPFFRDGLQASAYFRGENPAIAQKTVLRASKVETTDASGRRRVRTRMKDVVGSRVYSGFFGRFVTQQAQYLLGNGVTLGDPGLKARLGADFDLTLARMGEKALQHGVCWGYWNTDHLEIVEAVRDPCSGFFPLIDEVSGEARMGVQFWQLEARSPLCVRLFEPQGVSMWREEKGQLVPAGDFRPYRLIRRESVLGTELVAEAVRALPLVPFWANEERRSELTPAIRSKIDCYDRILSDFADNLDRANDVYWVLNNFGGTLDDIAEVLETIQRLKAVTSISDGAGGASTAEPHTISVPYEARQAALKLLEKALYQDYMALNMEELTGGSLTNVAIRAACASLDLKANRFEWQAYAFVRGILALLDADTEAVRFTRQTIADESEIIRNIQVMRPDIDRATALRLNPYLQPEEVDGLTGEERTA